MSSAFVSTLFTQTVSFAGDDFGVSDSAIGVAGSLVRAGIVLVLPMAVLADRRGRRIVVAVAVAAPLVTALGAFAPTFPFLVATQAIGRPLGLVLDFMIAVVAAEEMPRNSRAYAVSVLALASGLGAGVAIVARRRSPTSHPAHGGSSTSLRCCGCSWPSTSPAACPRAHASNARTSPPRRSTGGASPCS